MRLHDLVASILLLAFLVVPQAPGPQTALQSIVRDAYSRELSEAIPVPATYNDEHSVDCSGNGHAQTTASLRSPGGWSTLLQMSLSRDGARVIYMGNYSYWKKPLGAREWQNISRAVYHHEIAHHWGWNHEWSPSCGGTKLGFEPFLAAPILFGWEDVDGDGVPEILDETPYGRSR